MQRKYAVPVMLMAGLLISVPATLVRAHDDGQAGMEHKEHGWDEGKLQKDLGLTNDQVAKMKAQHESDRAAMKPLMDKQHELMEKLEGQVKNKASDSDLQATITDIRANRKVMADQMEQAHNQSQTILTPTQQAKMILKMHHAMRRPGMGDGKMMKKEPGSPY